MKELIKELRASSRLFRPVEHRAADALEAQQARIKELQECIEQRNRMINDLWKEKEMYVIKYNECRKAALLEATENTKETKMEQDWDMLKAKVRVD